MIESLGEHGVHTSDLTPALKTTHTIANPEYDPEEARLAAQKKPEEEIPAKSPSTATQPIVPTTPTGVHLQTTTNVLGGATAPLMEGVTTSLSASDENVTLDIRWTVLCDLFLTIIADSVYDARSRVLLETVANKLGLGWLDVTKFEKRVTDALEIQEATQNLENSAVIEGRMKAAKKRRYVMMGLATIGSSLTLTWPGLTTDLAFRRWSCDWAVCWSVGPSDRGRARGSFHDDWNHWYYLLFGRRWWCGGDYNGWGSHRIRYCWQRDGPPYATSADI